MNPIIRLFTLQYVFQEWHTYGTTFRHKDENDKMSQIVGWFICKKKTYIDIRQIAKISSKLNNSPYLGALFFNRALN